MECANDAAVLGGFIRLLRIVQKSFFETAANPLYPHRNMISILYEPC
jgi:hypothetical protein